MAPDVLTYAGKPVASCAGFQRNTTDSFFSD